MILEKERQESQGRLNKLTTIDSNFSIPICDAPIVKPNIPKVPKLKQNLN